MTTNSMTLKVITVYNYNIEDKRNVTNNDGKGLVDFGKQVKYLKNLMILDPEIC